MVGPGIDVGPGVASSFVGAIVGPGVVTGAGVVAGAGVAAGAGVILLCEMGHTSRLSRRSLQSLSGAATTAAASDTKMRQLVFMVLLRRKKLRLLHRLRERLDERVYVNLLARV